MAPTSQVLRKTDKGALASRLKGSFRFDIENEEVLKEVRESIEISFCFADQCLVVRLRHWDQG